MNCVCFCVPLHEEFGPVKVYAPVKPDGVWQVTWTAPGMPRQVKQRKTKEKAIALAKEIRGQLKRGEAGRRSRMRSVFDSRERRKRQSTVPSLLLFERKPAEQGGLFPNDRFDRVVV